MRWEINFCMRNGSIAALFLLLILSCSGCAQKPWGTSLEEKEYDSALRLANEMANNNNQCVRSIHTDLTVEYVTPLGKRSFSGYLLYSPPASYKFVISNPLGQPLFIIAGNQDEYQAINTLETKYISGGMTSFALRNQLPIHFLKGRWDDWLTGKNTISTEYITDINFDRQSRGIWFTFEDNAGIKNISHLLVDPEKKVIIEHVLNTRARKSLATIDYSDYLQNQSCLQPQNIFISGLDYGTTIRFQLSDTELVTETKTYSLNPPQGYLRQIRP
jgi:outer membrane biogenesis lipoprotein LolB